jgi:hypothetical protein
VDIRTVTMKLAVWQKDVNAIADFAKANGCPTPLFAATAPLYIAATANDPMEDTSAVCAVIEKLWELFPLADFETTEMISSSRVLRRCIVGLITVGEMDVPVHERVNMANVFSRTCTLFLVIGGLGIGACASPSRPSAIPSAEAVSSGLTALSQPSPGADSFGLTALSRGVPDATLIEAGWSCLGVGGGVTVCAPPGVGLPSIPPIPNYGGAPSYTLAAFVDHQFDHHVKFLRPDLFHGQPCVGGEPMDYFALLDYYHCIIPVR